MRYLALGDSYTIGEGVAPDERWPHQLVALLRDEGLPVETPEIIAQTGWTAAELRARIAAAPPEGPCDLVSLLIGANDQYRGLPIGDYRRAFAALLAQAAALARGTARRVVVVSIPDWSGTPFAEGRDRRQIDTAIGAFNAVNRAETEQRGIAYVDVTPLSRQMAGDSAYLASDGLHPSGAQYAAWARRVLPTARALLRTPAGS